MALAVCNTTTSQNGRELVEHGTVQFPVACYHDDLGVEEVPWHWHDELEVFLVTEGEAVVAAGTEKYTVKKGQGFFVNAGVLHAAWDAGNSGCRFHSIVFHPRLVGGSIDSVFWQNYVQPLLENEFLRCLFLDDSLGWSKEAVEAIEEAWQGCVKEEPGYEFFVRSNLSQLIFLLSGYRPTEKKRISQKSLRDGERIKKMLQFIQENYSGEISTRMIAECALISDSECLRCFRSMIGMPPIRYVKQFRVQKAVELLLETDLKITEIGTQCGFQDISYFTKTFREMKGCTPSEFRRNRSV